jgi:hypothetical protein
VKTEADRKRDHDGNGGGEGEDGRVGAITISCGVRR